MQKNYSIARRKQTGAGLVLVICCAVIIILLIVGAIQSSFLLNSAQIIRNSVEAGTLNIANHVPEVKTSLSGGGEAQYSDCLDTSGQIGIANINRVMGKALLENANAQEMLNLNQAGSGPTAASLAFASASGISQRLSNQLSDYDTLIRYFDALAPQSGSAFDENTGATNKLSAKTAQNASPPLFRVGYLHRGETSNISFDPAQIPAEAGVKFESSTGDDSSGDDDSADKKGSYLPGYKSTTINGQNIMLVSLRTGDMPHLVSAEEFDASAADRHPLPPGETRVPNAYYAAGRVDGSATAASASAVANPQRSYRLAIPFGYVVIHIAKTKAIWTVNGTVVKRTEYEFQREDGKWEIQFYDVGCGKLNGYANLGREYSDRSLLNAISALPGDHEPIFSKITQRMQEVDSGFSKGKLKGLLGDAKLQDGIYDYVIYPIYESEDHTDPQIRVDPVNKIKASWFAHAQPEGTGKTIVEEKSRDKPNDNYGKVLGIWKLLEHHVDMRGSVAWVPGTGANQCLGLVDIKREAAITFEGKCPP